MSPNSCAERLEASTVGWRWTIIWPPSLTNGTKKRLKSRKDSQASIMSLWLPASIINLTRWGEGVRDRGFSNIQHPRRREVAGRTFVLILFRKDQSRVCYLWQCKRFRRRASLKWSFSRRMHTWHFETFWNCEHVSRPWMMEALRLCADN